MAKNFKKFLILPVMAMVSVCLFSLAAKPVVKAGQAGKVEVSAVKTEINPEKLAQEMMESAFTDLGLPKADDYVWAIVSLKSESLVSRYNKANFNGSVSEYLKSEDGVKASKALVSEQEAVKARIKNAINAEFQYSYTTITNGFAVKIQYKDYAKLCSIEGVESVNLSINYALPEEEDAEEVTVNLATLAGAKSSSEVYRGQGMVVGILDTGLQVSHEAFSIMPSTTRMDSSSYEEALYDLAATQLHYSQNGVIMDASDLYVNEKVPFAYDYADLDNDVNPNLKTIAASGNDHGTHVAGIISGNNGKGFEGSAPDAQVAIFKVFSDKGGGATTMSIAAALNDAVIIGVDVINMSLGQSYGFSVDDPDYSYNKFVRAVDEAGISLVASAGNSYMSGIGSSYSYGTIETPDQGTISSPSAFYSALSVASFDTENEKAAAIEIGGVACIYNECVINQTTSEQTDFVALLAGDAESVEFEWAYVGLGTAEEVAKVDVEGKVAVVRRGDLTFAEKAQNVLDAGAVACVIFNNVGGNRFNPVVEGVDIPVCAISLEDGEKVIASSIKTCHFGKGVYIYGGTMSLFSSWGPTPSLELKPEITSYGGSVYSSLPNETGDAYGIMSGTSMSAPNMAGNVALVRQYLDNRFISYRESNDISATAYRILMSTATPIANRDNATLYSPRRQGAGLVNIDAALSTPAYFYVRGEQKAKIELGDDPDCTGVYTLKFILANMGNNTLSYKLNPKVLTTTINSTNPYALDGVSTEIKDSSYYYSVSGQGSIKGSTVTVEPKGEVAIEVKVVLSSSTKASLSASYPYGTYVEGFVMATSTGEQCDLSIPFLGFYGDWDAAPMFDSDVYDNQLPIAYDSTLVGLAMGGYYAFPLGQYLYKLPAGYTEPAPSQNHNFIAPYNSGAIHALYSVYMGLLRNASYITYDFYDANSGELLESIYGTNLPKAHVNLETGNFGPAAHALSWQEIYANNTKIKLVVTAHTCGENPYENSKYQIEFSLGIDFEAPHILGFDQTAEQAAAGEPATGGFNFTEENGRKYIEFDVQDNGALQSFCLYTSEQVALTDHIPFYTPNGEATHVKYDITEFVEELDDNKIMVYVDDYAMNYCAYIVTLPLHEVESVSFGSESYEIKTNQTINILADAYIEPENGYIISGSISLVSSDPSIVFVNENGTITGLSAGTATLTLSLQTVNNVKLSASCQVVVTEEAAAEILVTAVTVTPETATVKAGGSVTLFAELTPADATNQSISWSSSNEELATVDQSGVVTALKSGTVTITATSANGKKDSCVITITENYGDFDIVAGVLKTYKGSGGAVVVPDGVKEIAKDAFRNNKNVTSVIVPASCTKVGDYAFYGCTKLASISFACPEGLEIGAYTFSGCSVLEKVEGTQSVVSLGNRAFQNCVKLTEFALSDACTELGTYVFYGCTKLASVTYPATVNEVPDGMFRKTALTSFTVTANITSIGLYAFEATASLTELTFEPRTTALSIDNYAFNGCGFASLDLSSFDVELGTYVFGANKKLTSAKLPLDLTEIPQGIFNNCSALAEISYCAEPTSIGSAAFAGTAITEIVIPASVTSLGGQAFKDCAKLVKVVIECELPKVYTNMFSGCVMLSDLTIPQDYTVIQSNAFQNCKKLTSFVVAPTCTQIDTNAFSGCSGLTEVTLPAVFKTGGNSMFKDCTSLEKIYLNSVEEVKWQAGTTLAYKAFGNVDKVQIIASEDSFYESSNDGVIYSKGFKQICYVFAKPDIIVDGVATIRDEVEVISERAFSTLPITSVVFGSGLKMIEKYAFSETKLASVTLPASLELICEYAFYKITTLKELNFAEDAKLETIERAAFALCAIESLELPDSLVTLEDGLSGSGVFGGNKLTSVTFGKNLEYIGNYSFDCPSTTTWTNQIKVVDLSGTKVKYIGNYAFRYSPFEEVILSNCLESIGDYAFYGGAYNITNTKYIGHNVTAEHIVFPETLKTIGKYAFMGWCMLREVILPDSVEAISDSTFRICVSLEEIKLSASMTEIPTYAFGYLGYNWQTYNPNWQTYTPVSELYIPANIEVISTSAFSTSALISNVVVDPANQHFRSENGMLYSSSNQLIYVPPKLEALEEFVIPSFMTDISSSTFGAAAFKNVNAKRLIVPATVKSIGSLTFSGSKFEEIIFEPNGNITLASSVFANCANLKRVVLPEGLIGLPATLFQRCAKLEEVVMPSTVKLIGGYAFDGCTSLKSIELPDGIIQMFAGAFRDCTSLTSVTLPAMLEDIYGFGAHVSNNGTTPRMFEGCTKLTSLDISDANEYFTVVDNVLYNKDMTILYEYAQGLTATEFVVPEGVLTIKMRAFRDNKYLEKVVLPTTLKSVGDYAFYGCDALKEVTFLSAVAPSLEQTQCVVSNNTILNQGYCNFVKSNLVIETIYTVIDGINYVSVEYYYDPLTELTMIYPQNSKGYDGWAYNQLFATKQAVSVGEATAIDSLTATVCEDGVLLEWEGAKLGATYFVYANVPGVGLVLVGSTMGESFKDETALGVIVPYEYKVVPVVYSPSGKLEGVAKEVSCVRPQGPEDAAAAAVVKQIQGIDGSFLTSNKKQEVLSMVKAYNALSAADKAKVGNVGQLLSVYDVVSQAMNYDAMVTGARKETNISGALAQIKGLESKYSELKPTVKVYVESLDVIKAWKEEVEAARQFSLTLTFFEPADVTEADGAKIDQLNAQYAAFSAYQKSLVKSIYDSKMSEIQAKYLSVVEAIRVRNVKLVEELIMNLSVTPTAADKGSILAARNAFDGLSEVEQLMISPGLIAKLESCEKAVANLATSGCTVAIASVVVSTISSFSLLALLLKKREF